MNAWPLDESSYVTFENTIKDIFGKTNVKIDIVDIFNSGFLLYSNKDPTPTITVNTNDQFLLKMLIRRFLKCTIEHEYLHMFGVGKWGFMSINCPRSVPDTYRKDISEILNDGLYTMINCANVIIQQKQSHQYLDFEFEKLLYYTRNSPTLIRSLVLIQLGYLSGVGRAVGWNKPLNSLKSKTITDFTDKIILKRAEHLFDCFCQFDRNKNKVMDVSKQSLELDEAISLQKNYFLED